MRVEKYLSLFLSLILAFFSFAISYSALSNLAASQGITPSALFPLIIDGVMVLALVFRLYGSEREMAQIIMVGYVVLSIALNAVTHMNILGAVMASVAPISLFICSEISASMLHQKKKPAVKDANTACINRDSKGRFTKVV